MSVGEVSVFNETAACFAGFFVAYFGGVRRGDHDDAAKASVGCGATAAESAAPWL